MSNVQLGDELRIVIPRQLAGDPRVKLLWNLHEVERKLTKYFGTFVRVDGMVGTELGSTAVAIYDVPATDDPGIDLSAIRWIGRGAVAALGVDGIYTRGPDGTVRIVTRPPAPTINIKV